MDVTFHSIDGGSHLPLDFEDYTDPVQHVAVTLSHEGFAGHNPAAHFYRTDLVRFLAKLQFTKAHQGEATLVGMSPGGTELRVWAVDAARHAGLEAAVGRHVPVGHGMTLC